jgi:hypothetical protein
MRDPDRYEPIANRTYEALAEPYGCAILPARPRKPQDKAKVEAGVLLVERWILARLRHWRFHSLAELNTAALLLPSVAISQRGGRSLSLRGCRSGAQRCGSGLQGLQTRLE